MNLDPDPADGFDWSESEALAESLFGDASDAGAALQIQKADFTVSAIIDKIDRGKVNLRPSYQREYVWTVRTASKLLESLMLNIPIPTMFFHEIRNGALEVVDGKQRLTSVWSFVTGAFPDGTPFKLKGLDVFAEHNDKGFDELPAELRERILDFPLNVHTIGRQSQPEFVFEVFERLNMGATQLNEQELRNCIYQGTYTDLLLDLASDEHLLRVYRSKTPHLRMKDRELILRFFAMQRTTPEGMTSPVKAWLNEEMRENKDMTPQEARELKELFEETIKMVWEVFGESAFRPVKRNADILQRRRDEQGEKSEASEASSTRNSSSSSSLGGIFYRGFVRAGRGERRAVGHGDARVRGAESGGGAAEPRAHPGGVREGGRGKQLQEAAGEPAQGGEGEGGGVGRGHGPDLRTQGERKGRQGEVSGGRGRSGRRGRRDEEKSEKEKRGSYNIRGP